jgi:regulator of sirC expression with transglutaminase-like and TPR domain
MQTFARELNELPISVPRAGLLFAREIAYPQLDVPHYMQVLDGLAQEAEARVAEAENPADALVDFLFHEKGFRGNEEAYGDPRNSYLNEVLERRLGIPISLSVLYVAVARRLDIDAYGLSLPGHFIVGVRQGLVELLLDPFHDGRHLTLEDCERLVRQTTGLEGVLDPSWLRPATPRAILARMLNNLRVVYVQRERWPQAVAVIERLRQVQPDAPEHLRDLGLLHYQQGHLYPAAQYLEAYLEEEPESPEASAIRQNLQPVFSRWAQMN